MDARARLLALLTDRSFARRRVVLASGKESDFFIDCKQTVLTAQGHALVGELMLDALSALPPCVAVAGVELGGCPLASAVSLVSFVRNKPLDAVYVRKEAKDHGSKRLLEGNAQLAPGAAVVILEDVVTTGGSSLAAIQRCQEFGLVVTRVIAIIDRMEGGAQAFARRGFPLASLLTIRDFGIEPPT